jgi:hypothetical protein
MKKQKQKLASEWSRKTPLYMDKKDKRYKKHLEQLKSRGFSDSETWSLYSVIAEFIIPRLKRFKEINNGYPYGLTMKEWNTTIDKMVFAFEYLLDDERMSKFPEADDIKVQEGLRLFSEYFRALWW